MASNSLGLVGDLEEHLAEIGIEWPDQIPGRCREKAPISRAGCPDKHRRVCGDPTQIAALRGGCRMLAEGHRSRVERGSGGYRSSGLVLFACVSVRIMEAITWAGWK